MVITKTPLRVSFFGGGTDYPAWFCEHGGAVLSISINKYSYVQARYLLPFFPFKSKIVWSQIEDVNDHSEIKHPSVRETLKFLNIHEGVGVHYDGDLPARSGLGSSSSFTVGFLHSLYALQGHIPTKEQLAKEAIHIEQNCIKENVGSQDQIATAYGGFNKIEFNRDHSFKVTPMRLEEKDRQKLQNHMMLFFTGMARTASEIAHEQIQNIPKKQEELHKMRNLVETAVCILEKRKKNWLTEFGELLDESWQIKRSLSSQISNTIIDGLYQKAREHDAIGGKLLGAGGGGFLLIYARPENQESIRHALKDLLYVPFTFEDKGSQVLYKM